VRLAKNGDHDVSAQPAPDRHHVPLTDRKNLDDDVGSQLLRIVIFIEVSEVFEARILGPPEGAASLLAPTPSSTVALHRSLTPIDPPYPPLPAKIGLPGRGVE